MAEKLIGRNFELQKITSILEEVEPQILIVYGRRRVGKTTLLEHAFKAMRVLKIEGLEGQSTRLQIKHAVQRLIVVTRDPKLFERKIESWKEFFIVLSEYIGVYFDIIYLEEIQWLANYRTQLIAELKYVWDNYFIRKQRLLLVLCGSSPSFIVSKIVHSKALYNRSQHEMHVKPFTLLETLKYLGNKISINRALEAYLYVGGVPEYLKKIAKQPSFIIGMANNSFTQDSFFLNEYDKIFTSSLANNPVYKRIIQYLSKKGKATRSEIQRAVKINSGGGLTDILDDLLLSAFIGVEDSVLTNNNKNKRYYILDAFILFYNRFIFPNAKAIMRGEYNNEPLRLLSKSQTQSFLGYNFEHFCLNNTRNIAATLGFSSVRHTAGSLYWVIDNKSFQIDLIFLREDKVMTICEVKYGDKPIDAREARRFQERVDNLLQSHQFKKYKRFRIETALVTASEAEIVASKEVTEGLFFNRLVTMDDFRKYLE